MLPRLGLAAAVRPVSLAAVCSLASQPGPGVTAAAGVFAHLDRAPSAAGISPAGSEEIRIARFITTPATRQPRPD